METTYDVLSRRVQEATAADFGKLERAIADAFEKGDIVDWMVLRLMRQLRGKK